MSGGGEKASLLPGLLLQQTLPPWVGYETCLWSSYHLLAMNLVSGQGTSSSKGDKRFMLRSAFPPGQEEGISHRTHQKQQQQEK
eukprot:581463-Pelagomonas_calceolata.AAC.2